MVILNDYSSLIYCNFGLQQLKIIVSDFYFKATLKSWKTDEVNGVWHFATAWLQGDTTPTTLVKRQSRLLRKLFSIGMYKYNYYYTTVYIYNLITMKVLLQPIVCTWIIVS